MNNPLQRTFNCKPRRFLLGSSCILASACDPVRDDTRFVAELAPNPMEPKTVLARGEKAMESIWSSVGWESTTSNDRAEVKETWTGSVAEKFSNLASPLLDRFHGDAPEATEGAETELAPGQVETNDSSTGIEPGWRDAILERMMASFVSPLGLDRLDVQGTLNVSQISNQTLAGVIGVPLFLILIWRRRKKNNVQANSETARARTLSADNPDATNRPRTASRDLLRMVVPGRDRAKSDDLSSPAKDKMTMHGPGIATVSYETWTPPLQWSEASRQLVPRNTKSVQQCKLTLDVQKGTLSSTKEGSFVIQDLSIHVKPPNVGGVLELYVKGAPKEEWMEHTFSSAQAAAQFQQDLTYYQVAGETIYNMYEALELVHKGSCAHIGEECVLHDITSDTKKGAVAWDDAMRCFSSIPCFRTELERDLGAPTTDNEEQDGATEALSDDYVNKRSLMGYVDFFRIFSPPVKETAVPQPDASPDRVEHMLGRRKQMAQAAVFVQAYVLAKTVANKGWVLPRVGGDAAPESLVKRLAYDMDVDNTLRDSASTNEYYEATVGRDVRCNVHSAKHMQKAGSSVQSQYQGYSLVGSHVFKLPPKGGSHPLIHTRDPVLALPSLRKLMTDNPDLDFFVCAFFPEGPRVAFVHVFVRSLPKGIDDSFDTIVDRFVNGSTEVRQRKLEVFLQLGPGAKLSPLAWAALKAVSLFLSWSRRGEPQIPFESGADRTPFPGMTMSNYMETKHFGGALQSSPTLPKNYVSVTAHVDASKMHMAPRVLYQRLEETGLPCCVVDFSFVLEGQQVDELPERTLGTIRLVHVDPIKSALPIDYSGRRQLAADDAPEEPDDLQTSPRSGLISTLSMYGPAMVSQRVVTGMSSIWGSVVGSPTEDEAAIMPQEQSELARARPATNDPFQAGIDVLSDILHGVTVPVRRENLSNSEILQEDSDNSMRQESPSMQSPAPKHNVINVSVLSRTSSSDIRRYFLAENCDLKRAAVRIVESAAWRGATFPIDTRSCRVELQSGQFFQQGTDVDGDPVFYFQNMLLGPWRQDVDASVAALLHRLETCLVDLSQDNPDVTCTVIVLTGKPRTKKKKRDSGDKSEHSSVAGETKDTTEVEGDEVSIADEETVNSVEKTGWSPYLLGINPRMSQGEDYHVHSNIEMIYQLVDVLSSHYPERLKRFLLVKGGPGYVGATLSMRKYITSARTRAKVLQVSRVSEMTKYVDENELSTIVGGKAKVRPAAFEI